MNLTYEDATKIQELIDNETIIVIYSLPTEIDEKIISFFNACYASIISQQKLTVNYNGIKLEISNSVKFILVSNKTDGTLCPWITSIFNIFKLDCNEESAYNYLRVLFIDKGSNNNYLNVVRCFNKMQKGVEHQLNCNQSLKDYFNVNTDEAVWTSPDLEVTINDILKQISMCEHQHQGN